MAYIPPGRRGSGNRRNGPGSGVPNRNPSQRRSGSGKAAKVGTHHVVRKAGKAPEGGDDPANIMHIPKRKKTKPARVPGKIVKAATRTVATAMNQAVSNYLTSSVNAMVNKAKPGSTHHIVQKAKTKVPKKAKSFFAKLKVRAKAAKRKLFG